MAFLIDLEPGTERAIVGSTEKDAVRAHRDIAGWAIRHGYAWAAPNEVAATGREKPRFTAALHPVSAPCGPGVDRANHLGETLRAPLPDP